MLIRYVDGPWQGTTVETDQLAIEGVHDHGDGTVQVVRYMVDRQARTAKFVEWGDRWYKETGQGGIRVPWLEPGAVEVVPDPEDGHTPAPRLLCEATVPELLTEFARRGFRAPLSTPMRRRRRDLPRAGFGQAAWPNEGHDG